MRSVCQRVMAAMASVLGVVAATAVMVPTASADLLGKGITGRGTFNGQNFNIFNADILDPTPTPATVGQGVEFVRISAAGASVFQYQIDVQADRVVIQTSQLNVGNSYPNYDFTLTGLNFGGNTLVTGGTVLSSTHNGGPAAIIFSSPLPGTMQIRIPAGGIGANAVQSTTIVFTTGMGNDACANAIPIGLGATAFSNVGATTDGLNHIAACNAFNSPGVANDIWFTHTAAVTGRLTVSTCGSTFDTEVNVYTAGVCPGTDATLLGCNDDTTACGSNNSQLDVNVTAGQTYLIRVGSYDGGVPLGSGTGTLTLTATSTGACCNRWTGACGLRSAADCTAAGLRFDGLGAACSPAACKACPADFDGSGALAVQDIFNFLSSWFAGCP